MSRPDERETVAYEDIKPADVKPGDTIRPGPGKRARTVLNWGPTHKSIYTFTHKGETEPYQYSFQHGDGYSSYKATETIQRRVTK